MKTAVLGANGQLGTDLVEIFTMAGHDVVGLTHQDIEVTLWDSVISKLRALRPDVIVNTTAFHVVPKCEEHPETAFAVNAIGTWHVTRAAQELGARMVYYSTDYVFDGKKGVPYVETDLPNPLNVYGTSKLAGEHLTLNYAESSCVLRVSGIYGKIPCRGKGGNFITTVLRLAREKPEVRIVADERLTPTPTLEIARKTLRILEAGAPGLFHLTCEGECSWFEFAQTVFEVLGLRTPLLPTTAQEFGAPVKRPAYSVLDNHRYNQLRLEPMPDWKAALTDFLRSQYR